MQHWTHRSQGTEEHEEPTACRVAWSASRLLAAFAEDNPGPELTPARVRRTLTAVRSAARANGYRASIR